MPESKKISQLSPADAVLGEMQFEVNNAGVSERVTALQIKNYATAGGGEGGSEFIGARLYTNPLSVSIPNATSQGLNLQSLSASVDTPKYDTSNFLPAQNAPIISFAGAGPGLYSVSLFAMCQVRPEVSSVSFWDFTLEQEIPGFAVIERYKASASHAMPSNSFSLQDGLMNIAANWQIHIDNPSAYEFRLLAWQRNTQSAAAQLLGGSYLSIIKLAAVPPSS